MLLLCLSAYATVLHGDSGFVWDDVAITDNRIVKAPSGIIDIWFRPSQNTHEEHYWPLVYTTFWAEHQLWGLWAPGYHTVNVLLHAANCLLIWTLLRRLAIRGSWLAAALFAVHPVHAESVAWIIERKDVLSALFYLLAFHAHLDFADTRRRSRQLIAVALFVAGLLSKSILVTLPVAVLIVLWWRRGSLTRQNVLDVAPMFAVGFLIAAIDSLRGQLYYPNRFEIPLAERILIAPRAFWFYLEKLIWPADQMAIYPKWEHGIWSYIALGVVAAVYAALWLLRKQIGRGPIAAFAFYIVTLGPILGLVTFGFLQYSFVADRYQYLASIGPIALFAAIATRVLVDRMRLPLSACAIAAALLLGAGVFLTARHAYAYGDAEALWTRNLVLNPEAWEAHQQLGRLLTDRGLVEENAELGQRGIGHLQRSIELNPGYHEAHYNLGTALHIRTRSAEAEAHFRRAVELDPDYGLAHNGLGAVLAETGRYREAIPHFEEALDINPYNVEAAENLRVAREEMARSR